jgi:hypothetical protein
VSSVKKNKKILLLVGPQGSGNHLWSKVFALHKDVNGWEELLDESDPENYLIPHYREPHIHIWEDIPAITEEIMGDKDYLVVSASLPYWKSNKLSIPDIDGFAEHVQKLGIEVIVGVIGRDRNILTKQQTRLRGSPSFGVMTQVVHRLLTATPFFLSTELLYLYRQSYLESLSKWLDFPIDYENPHVEHILREDANAKYVTHAENPFVDAIVRSRGNKLRDEKNKNNIIKLVTNESVTVQEGKSNE